jgi:hypothetical protein
MIEIGLSIISFLAGCVVTHIYYRRASKEAPEWAKAIPEWAKPLIAKLPDQPISLDRLAELYHEELELGNIRPDPISGYLVCPKCGASTDQFESWATGN